MITLRSAELAEIMYQAYGEQAGWVNFQGRPMPQWAKLPEHIKACWEAAAWAAMRELGPN